MPLRWGPKWAQRANYGYASSGWYEGSLSYDRYGSGWTVPRGLLLKIDEMKLVSVRLPSIMNNGLLTSTFTDGANYLLNLIQDPLADYSRDDLSLAYREPLPEN